MSLHELRRDIEQKRALVGIIGLGYVGLPVACMFAQAGFRVIGLDMQADRVAMINLGQCPIVGEEPGLADLVASVVAEGRLHASTQYSELGEADVILIAVETPVEPDHRPRYHALRSVCASLGPVLKPGALVIVESTVAPGTVERVVRPLLERTSGQRADIDFFLGMCPERVMPGRLIANLRTMSRVCGGSTPEVAETMVRFYRQVVHADLDTADLVTAELVKTAENAYRDVQIAFANEVALICEANGANVWRVRELVNKSPSRQMHLPGAGVGGHCIPKDSWLLASAADERIPLKLIPAARLVNDAMPIHMADITVHALETMGCPVDRSRVVVLGYAYLENSDDIRNSPSATLVARLHDLGVTVTIHDPWVAAYRGDFWEGVAEADAVVLMVGHEAFQTIDLDALRRAMRTPIVIDGRGLFDPAGMEAAGFIYRGVGRGAVVDAPLR